MDQVQARSLYMYLMRAKGIIPTTGTEWDAISGATAMIEAVANGYITVDIKPSDSVTVMPPQQANPVDPLDPQEPVDTQAQDLQKTDETVEQPAG